MQSYPSAAVQVPNKYPKVPVRGVGGRDEGDKRRRADRRTLTDKFVAALKPAAEGTRYAIHDGRTGLAVRVTDSGERSWIVRPYLGGRQVLATLGVYPDTSLEDARTLARGALQAAADGVDPRGLPRDGLRAIAAGDLKPKAAARGADFALTFGDLAEKFLASPAVAGKSSERETRRILQTYFQTNPTADSPSVNWKHSPVADLDRREVNAALEALVERGRVQANQCARTLNRLFRWAAKKGQIEAVPVFDTAPGGEERERDRELTPKELRAVWNASYSEAAFGPYLRFVLATGLRRDEAAGALREKLDRKGRTLRVTVKGGREFVLPLNALALEAIKAAGKKSDLYIFSASGKPLNAWSKMMARIRRASKTDGWTLHDARRTLRSGLAMLGVRDEVAERCLAHVVGNRIAKTYNRYEYLDEKRAAFDLWAKHLRKIVTGRAR